MKKIASDALLYLLLLLSALLLIFKDWSIQHGDRSFPFATVLLNVACIVCAIPEGAIAAILLILVAAALQQGSDSSYIGQLANGPFLGAFAAFVRIISLISKRNNKKGT